MLILRSFTEDLFHQKLHISLGRCFHFLIQVTLFSHSLVLYSHPTHPSPPLSRLSLPPLMLPYPLTSFSLSHSLSPLSLSPSNFSNYLPYSISSSPTLSPYFLPPLSPFSCTPLSIFTISPTLSSSTIFPLFSHSLSTIPSLFPFSPSLSSLPSLSPTLIHYSIS